MTFQAPAWLFPALAALGVFAIGAALLIMRATRQIPPPPTEMDPVYADSVRREHEEIARVEAEIAVATADLQASLEKPADERTTDLADRLNRRGR